MELWAKALEEENTFRRQFIDQVPMRTHYAPTTQIPGGIIQEIWALRQYSSVCV